MPRIQHKTTGPAVSEPPKPFHPTPEQAAVLDLVKFIALNPGYGPAPGIGFIPADPKLPNTLTVVQAKPGSGKTATAVHAIKEAFLANPRLNFRLLAFNDNAATELQQRLHSLIPQAFQPWGPRLCSTTHSYGRWLLQRHRRGDLEIRRDKYWLLLDAARKTRDPREVRQAIVNLADVWRNQLLPIKPHLSTADMDLIMPHIAGAPIDMDPEVMAATVAAMVRVGIEAALTKGIIDFTDMISTPAYMGLTPLDGRHDIVIVDEFQDNNAAQQAMVLACTHHMVCIGDQNQAIYAFRGAGCNNMSEILDFADSKSILSFDLRLSINFRSDKDIIELARHIAPDMQASPGAAQGQIWFEVGWDELHRQVQEQPPGPGNTYKVLARRNKPLIQLFMYLLKRRIRVYRLSNDEQDALSKTLMDSIAMGRKPENLQDMKNHVNRYFADRIALLEDKAKKSKAKDKSRFHRAADDLCDLWDCMTMIFEDSTVTDPNDVVSMVNALTPKAFDPTAVELSTIHRAKGTEADTVYLIGLEHFGPESNGYLASPYPLTDIEWDQEINLAFVAVTRARHRLWFHGKCPVLFDRPVQFRVQVQSNQTEENEETNDQATQ